MNGMRPWPGKETVIGLLLLAGTFVAYFMSPIQKMGDAEYTMLLSEQLLVKQTFQLDEYFWPHLKTRNYPGMLPGLQWPRQVQPGGRRQAERRGVTEGHLYYIYPYGSSLLSLPVAAACRLAGISTVGSRGRYDPAAERKMQRVGASLLMAAACLVFFRMARLLLAPGWSLAIALSAGFGTQVWSTTSRSLQSHTWDVMLLALACFLLLRASVRKTSPRPMLLATFLAWGFIVRPTAVLYIVPLTLLVLASHRRHSPALIATGAGWLAAFLALNQAVLGQLLPDYYLRGSGLGVSGWGVGLAGQLISPSRGLLVFVPLVALVAYLLVAYRARLGHRPLALAAGAAVVLHLLVVSAFHNWWGGECYGARFSSDLVPLFVLLGILGLRARLDDGSGQPGGAAASRSNRARRATLGRRLELTAFAASLAVGLLLNGAGALSKGGVRWNKVPVPIGQQPMRAFDWGRSQWMCALFPDLLPELLPGPTSATPVGPGGG